MKLSHALKVVVPAVSLALFASAAAAQTKDDMPPAGAGLATSTCNETVKNRLKEYGVDWDGIEEKDAYPVSMGREGQTQTGYNYWIQPDDCTDGFIVIDTAASCAIRNVYTTGTCSVAGVPNYD